MRVLVDCHMHTQLCGHATGTLAQMVRAVADSGLIGAVMTEHLPLKPELDPDGIYAMRGDIDEQYVEQLRRIRGEWGGVGVVIGVEADWIASDPEWTRESVHDARAKGVEVVLGSVHFLDGWAFDDPDMMTEWDNRDVQAVWDEYFTQWCAAARSGLFEVMSHPDLVKKFGHIVDNALDYYDEAARVAAETGVLCEVSTAGWRKPVNELYPHETMIELLIQRGVGLTMASDAHNPSEVAYRFDDCAQVLYQLGARQIAYPQREGRVTWLEL
ncbi:MAG: histidinol-phosphatase HisJ family protein [Coriobacteriia bacterium]|nr:histidinol-phosphatase HisJ family protein [Coriobacteriia bacterium]